MNTKKNQKESQDKISDEMVGNSRPCPCGTIVDEMLITNMDDEFEPPPITNKDINDCHCSNVPPTCTSAKQIIKQTITILIGFAHDFAAGCWAASLFAVYWTNNHLSLGIENSLVMLKKDFFLLGLACIAIVLLTGTSRSFTYINNVYGEKAEKTRRVMLITKHIILFGIFTLGTWWQYHTVFR